MTDLGMNEPPAARRSSLRAMLCPRCELAPLRNRHCKLVCEACGYVESCEDNLPMPAAGSGGMGRGQADEATRPGGASTHGDAVRKKDLC
ncbi:MAG: hypothetical protein HY763_07475 [Planctomycetes bacterium]|nr:hypothetical protein [Planctomycetota bacterium]